MGDSGIWSPAGKFLRSFDAVRVKQRAIPYIWAVLEWLIVGGGVQGTYLSHVLTSSLGAGRGSVRVLDPHPDPLQHWQQTTAACGMQFLRSPAAHHIGLRTNELLDFAREHYPNWQELFLEPYMRPSLELWNEHAIHVIERHGLEELRIAGLARAVTRRAGGYRVATQETTIDCRRLILAVGNSQALYYPALAAEAVLSGQRVRHVFDPQFDRNRIGAEEHVVIIGSGVTAAQLAISLADRSTGQVTVVTDRLPDISWFDSDPGWNGPRLLSRLAAITDPRQRLSMVSAARIRGSFPGDTAAQLLSCMAGGRVRMLVDTIQSVKESAGGVNVFCAAGSLNADRLVFATGFSQDPPSLAMIRSVSEQLGLQQAGSGWPVVSQYCEWSPGMYVCGALAQLELGPVSRNISGIRSFARRLKEKMAM